MPGIFGIITRRPANQAREELGRMLRSVRHESFYRSGSWSNEELGLYTGWVGRGDEFPAEGPVHIGRGGVTWICYGGRVRGLGSGARVPGGDSASTDGGPANQGNWWWQRLNRLNGIFQGLLVEPAAGTIVLFNDRYGLGRLYIHESEDALYFAAEAKAILAVRPEARRIDLKALGEYVSFGCTIENRTLFRGIRLLPPGSAWRFRNAQLEEEGSYFSPADWEQQEALDQESYYREIRDTVAGAFPAYVTGEGRTAVALTGGLDTRVVMAWGGAKPNTLPCYTFGGSIRESRDVRIAREVARICHQPHQVLQVGRDFLSRFAHYAERTVWLSDGTVGVANAADLFVSEAARAVAPIKVVGTWGSELLQRVVTFKPFPPLRGLFAEELVASCQQAEAAYGEMRRCHPLTFAAFRQTPWAQYGIEALEQSQIGIRAPFLDRDFVRTCYRAPNWSGADVRARLIREASPQLASIPSDRGVLADSATRFPLARRLWQEFLFKAEYAHDTGMPQWLVRANYFLSPLHIDRLFLGRHKFTHFRVWYREQLAEYVKEILLDGSTLSRPYIVPSRLREIVHRHLNGIANYTTELHTLLTLELIQRRLAGV